MLNYQIAEKLGVNPITLSRWRSGDRFPSRDMMLRIEDKLGWSVADQMAAYNTSLGENRGDYGKALKEFLAEKYEVPAE